MTELTAEQKQALSNDLANNNMSKLVEWGLFVFVDDGSGNDVLAIRTA